MILESFTWLCLIIWFYICNKILLELENIRKSSKTIVEI
jgi:hypothetical protein